MKPMKQSAFGTYLYNYRKKHKLTQQELADILSITMNYCGRLERGERPPGIDLLIRVSDTLNVSIDTLLKDESEYASKQAANEYVEKIEALPRVKREQLYNVIDIFLSLSGDTK